MSRYEYTKTELEDYEKRYQSQFTDEEFLKEQPIKYAIINDEVYQIGFNNNE